MNHGETRISHARDHLVCYTGGMRKCVIEDWMGNVLFGGMLFPSFEDGWGFIYQMDPNSDDPHQYDDYFVMEVEE